VCLAGDPFDEGVGHDLPARPRITLADEGVGVLLERGVGGDALLHGQHAGQPAHGVRRRTQTHVPVADRVAQPPHVARRVESIGQPLDLVLHPAIAPPADIGRHCGVDLRAVLGRQPGRLPGDDHRRPFTDDSGLQRREGARQLAGEDLRPTDVPRGVKRRLPLRQAHLGCDPARSPVSRHPVSQLRCALRRRERRRLSRLRRGRGRLQLLEQPDPVDAHSVIDV
jgi:hypothetical protein